MAHILIMPRQGNTVESCIIMDWKVKEGDEVTAQTTMCEVETDKASFEIQAGAVGTVLKLLHTPGDDVPVLQPIAVIGKQGEEWEKETREIETVDCGSPPKINNNLNSPQITPPPSSLSTTEHLCRTNSGTSPRARNLAAKESMPLEAISGSGPGGRIIYRDVEATLEKQAPLTVAAKAVRSQYIPNTGSGLNGRITLDDINSDVQYSLIPSLETPIKGIRKIVSERMSKSLLEAAQFTLNSSASASKLIETRSQSKKSNTAEGLSKVTINDLVVFAVSRTLPHFLYMNAHKTGDIIKIFESIHIAIAVDTPRGLMVPVIRNANLLSLAQISAEAKRLSAACQNGTANPDELTGSTFTISNLGSMGITGFTPILNIPEVSILGVCSIEMKSVPVKKGLPIDNDSLFRCEPHIGFSLTINHQAVDGAPAAKFLKTLCETVANIDQLLESSSSSRKTRRDLQCTIQSL